MNESQRKVCSRSVTAEAKLIICEDMTALQNWEKAVGHHFLQFIGVTCQRNRSLNISQIRFLSRLGDGNDISCSPHNWDDVWYPDSVVNVKQKNKSRRWTWRSMMSLQFDRAVRCLLSEKKLYLWSTTFSVQKSGNVELLRIFGRLQYIGKNWTG